MNGEGKGFASALAKAADRHNWVLAGPTISYGDWLNPESVAREDAVILQRLHATIKSMPALTGRRLKPQVRLFGFSRGAQIAHRYALAYPEDVSSVVAYSAGTYTLPMASADIDLDGNPDTLLFPYGIADLGTRIGHPVDRVQVRQVRFLIGVGANDNRPGDVPRQWDRYVGKSRVERAQQFHSVLKKSGSNCTLKVFPGTGHEVTQDMLALAEVFFEGDEVTPTSLIP
jgi:dienelactone hydrolase